MTEFDELDNEVKKLTDGAECSSDVATFIEDSITFSKALWDLLKQQGLQHPSNVPDITVMEKTIDRIYGELAAACMMFSDNAYDKLPLLFVGIANKLAAADPEDVPPQLVQGFRDFAVRLENTQKSKKLATEVLTKAEV